MNNKIKKPNLFIVGAPKCGTTSLHYYLNQHPEIFMSEPKEPYHFMTDLIEESDRFHGLRDSEKYFPYRSREKYLQVFSNVKNEKIIGESSVFYLYSKTAAREIYKFNPEAKIIIMLREPVDFIYSYYWHSVRIGIENIYKFERALEAEKHRKKGKMLHKRVTFPSLLFYTELAKFSEQVERYFKVFPKEQIKIIIFDDFKKDTEKVYVDVLKFLGVKLIKNINFEPINKGAYIKRPKLRDFIEKLGLDYILKTMLPKPVFNILRQIVIKDGYKPPMNEELKIKLKKQFKPEVEKLSDLLNRDLITLWGYDKLDLME